MRAGLDSALLATAALAFGCGGCGGPPTPSAPSSAPPSAPPAADELGAAGQLLEAAITATGGRAAKLRHSSMRATGEVQLPQLHATGRLELLWAAPRQQKTAITLPPLGSFGSGCDGEVAWEQAPMQGARIFTGAEATRRLREATFNADLQWRTLYARIEVKGEVALQGAPAIKLVATASDGAITTMYFDKASHLPLGTEATVQADSGPVPTKTFYADYRAVDGVRIPFHTTIEQGPLTIETRFDTVEWDPALPAEAFALPPELRTPPAR